MKLFLSSVLQGLTVGIILLFPCITFSQTSIPRQMTYQGILNQGENTVPDGMYSITFSLYNNAREGMPLWSETQSVEIKGGLFNVMLGRIISLPVPLPADAWIGMNINSTGEMPRTKLTSSAYAFNSATAQALSPDATGAVLSLNGQQGALEVRGTDGLEVRTDKGILTIGKVQSEKNDGLLNQGTEWVLAGNGNATSSSWLGTSNNIPLVMRTNNVERMRILTTGNVGIGEATPNARLSVARTLHLTNTGGTPELRMSAPSGSNTTTFKTTGQSANITYTLPDSDGDQNEVLMTDGSGVLSWVDRGWGTAGNDNISTSKFIGTTNNQPFILRTNNIERLRVTGNGAIGIDEDTPTQKLEVAGNVLIKSNGSANGELRLEEPAGNMGKNYVGLKAGNMSNNIVFTLPVSYPSSQGQLLISTTNGVTSWINPDSLGLDLQYFVESRHNVAPNDVIPVHRLTALGANSSIDIALSPKGTGALTAHVADNTAIGGNKRGQYAVDLQLLRTNANEVASGISSSIGGGASNQASGNYSTIGGGLENVTSGIETAIPGGRGLTLSGVRSFGFLANAGSNAMTVSADNTAVLGNTNLWLANNDNSAKELRFYEANSTATGSFPPSGINYTAFKAQAQSADITYTLPSADGTSGQVLSTNGSGVLSWNTIELQHFSESVNTTAPNAFRTVVQLLANNAATDVDIALSPKGTGALTAQVADGAVSGGNKRGIYATD